ncbi:hypothetical protein V8E52_005342 [Russula decolorans]
MCFSWMSLIAISFAQIRAGSLSVGRINNTFEQFCDPACVQPPRDPPLGTHFLPKPLLRSFRFNTESALESWRGTLPTVPLG